MSFWIFSVNGAISFRLRAENIEKRFKGLQFFGYANPSPSIQSVMRVIRIITPTKHSLPAIIFLRMLIAGCVAVLHGIFLASKKRLRYFTAKTTAGFDSALKERIGSNKFLIAAITSAFPDRAGRIDSKSNHRESSEPLAGDIFMISPHASELYNTGAV